MKTRRGDAPAGGESTSKHEGLAPTTCCQGAKRSRTNERGAGPFRADYQHDEHHYHEHGRDGDEEEDEEDDDDQDGDSELPPLRRPEPLEPLGEVVTVGAEPLGSGDANPPAIHVLEPVLQHRAVNLREHVGANRDPVVGRDAEDVGVEGAVVDLAEGEAVRRASGRASRGLAGAAAGSMVLAFASWS